MKRSDEGGADGLGTVLVAESTLARVQGPHAPARTKSNRHKTGRFERFASGPRVKEALADSKLSLTDSTPYFASSTRSPNRNVARTILPSTTS